MIIYIKLYGNTVIYFTVKIKQMGIRFSMYNLKADIFQTLGINLE